MKLSKFKYKLPDELIALYPTPNRDESRLMVVHQDTGKIEHKTFKDIIEYFGEDDVLVFNDTKVFPARLYGNKEKTGAEIEVFLLRELNQEPPERFVLEINCILEKTKHSLPRLSTIQPLVVVHCASCMMAPMMSSKRPSTALARLLFQSSSNARSSLKTQSVIKPSLQGMRVRLQLLLQAYTLAGN